MVQSNDRSQGLTPIDVFQRRYLRRAGSAIVLRPGNFPETRASMLSAMRGGQRESAWREFFSCYAPPIFRAARQFGLGEEDAEEIVQRVMITVSQHIEHFRYDRDRGKFRNWVQTITTNRVRDRLRGVQRDQVRSVNGFDLRHLDATTDDEASMWAQEWLLQDTLWCLEQVRGEFAPHRYEAFRLSVIEGLPVAEVAQKLGMTPGHIYVTRSQVAKRVRELMERLNRDWPQGRPS